MNLTKRRPDRVYKHSPTDKEIKEMYGVLPDKIPFTPLQIALVVAGGVCLAVSVLWLVWRWQGISDIIPTHYGLSGRADSWGSKQSLCWMLAASGGLYGVITVLLFFPKFWNVPYRYAKEDIVWVFVQMRTMLCILAFEIVVVFGVLNYYAAMAKALPFGALFLPIVMGALLAPVVYCWRRLKKRAL